MIFEENWNISFTHILNTFLLFSFLNSAREKKNFQHTGRKIDFDKGGIIFQEKKAAGNTKFDLSQVSRMRLKEISLTIE